MNNICYKDKLNNISLTIKEGLITGITGNYYDYILNILSGNVMPSKGNVLFDNKTYLSGNNLYGFLSDNDIFYTSTVLKEFELNLKKTNHLNYDLLEKINNMLTLVGLDDSYIFRKTNTLSTSEKYLIKLALILINNPTLIIINSNFSILDNNNNKRLFTILKNLKEDKKTIIIGSNNIDILYQLTDEIIILDNNEIFASGYTDNIYTNSNVLSNTNINKPILPLITYKAKELKNIKISYHKDSRDIIKDIYKHV